MRPPQATRITTYTPGVTAPHLDQLVRRYTRSGPRYTSYPTALHFVDQTPQTYAQRLRTAARRVQDPWSVYIHVPFCRQRCTFCACAVVPTREHDRVAPQLVAALGEELRLVGAQIGERRKLAQLHLGGGTPTYLEPHLLDELYTQALADFEPLPDMESSIELDPRVTTGEHVEVLSRHGVNRISLGVQDFDAEVQREIGRDQSAAQTHELVRLARAGGMDQINMDLVYGLPGQSLDTIRETVAQVVEMAPTRVALYGYAHVPWMRANQRAIRVELLPRAERRLELFLAARAAFEAAGYESIGLDHFALPSDPLARAYDEGRVHRNFMGYTVKSGADTLGLGPTAIGDVDGAMFQNEAKLGRWHAAVAAGSLPVASGLVRSEDDLLRGQVIADLMCRGAVSKAGIAARFEIDFDHRFELELRDLEPFLADALVVNGPEHLTLTERGRTFVRNIAMVFDAYQPGSSRHSSTI